MSPWSPDAYSKAKLQVPAPDRQVKAALGPNVAAINTLVVVQSAPTAVHPAALKDPPLTVPSRYPWKVPLMPDATTFPWCESSSQPPGLAGPVVTNVPFLKSSRTLNVPSPLSWTVRNRSKLSTAHELPQLPPSGSPAVANGPRWVDSPEPLSAPAAIGNAAIAAATATVASQRLIACLPAPCVQYRFVKGTLSVRQRYARGAVSGSSNCALDTTE